MLTRRALRSDAARAHRVLDHKRAISPSRRDWWCRNRCGDGLRVEASSNGHQTVGNCAAKRSPIRTP